MSTLGEKLRRKTTVSGRAARRLTAGDQIDSVTHQIPSDHQRRMRIIAMIARRPIRLIREPHTQTPHLPVVFLKPCLRSILVRGDLEVFAVADLVNSRRRPRFNARMTPTRVNIVGPPSSTTSINASMAACHFGRAASFAGSAVICLAASRKTTSFPPPGSAIGSSNSRLQPDLRSDIFLAPGTIKSEARGRRNSAQRGWGCLSCAARHCGLALCVDLGHRKQPSLFRSV